LFFFYCFAAHLDLHSFPTRRSSDLDGVRTDLIFQNDLVAGATDRVIRLGRHDEGKCLKLRCGVQLAAVVAANEYLRKVQRSPFRSEEHTSELQSRENLVCRLLLEKK